QTVLDRPEFQSILQLVQQDQEKALELSETFSIPKAKPRLKFLWLPRWVWGIAFIAFFPLLGIGIVYNALSDYNHVVYGPHTEQGGMDSAVALTANKSCYQAGDEMLFEATVTNRTTSPYVAELEDESAFDLVLTFGQTQIYRW